MKSKYNLIFFRCPDECYLIKFNDKMILKIIEKKEQNVAGSVDIKLWSAPSLKREYEILVDGKMKIEYAFCLNSFI
jgi:hypothetical protein